MDLVGCAWILLLTLLTDVCTWGVLTTGTYKHDLPVPVTRFTFYWLAKFYLLWAALMVGCVSPVGHIRWTYEPLKLPTPEVVYISEWCAEIELSCCTYGYSHWVMAATCG